MTFAEEFGPEFEAEMATTRRLLERVPSEKGDWKPHPKSFALAHLAQLVATMPGWMAFTLRGEDMDLANAPGYGNQPTEVLLQQFDEAVAQVRAELGRVTDEDLEGRWSLTRAGQVLMTTSRRAVTRQTLLHLSHHRGQLTVYLRMLDVPIPSIYGPTADERW